MKPDQAHNLRTIAEEQRLNAHRNSGPSRCRVVTITGGKGGVGKTTCAVNLALALQAMGLRTLLFDADISLANVDVMLNLNPGLGLPQVLRGECALYSVIAEGPLGLHILPGGNGLAEFANLGSLQLVYLLGELRGLEQSYDVLIVDTAAGIGTSVTSFCQFANDIVIVSMPEPTAMLDAYGLLKALAVYQPAARMSLLMNMVRSTQEGEAAWNPLAQTVKKYLGLELELLGSIPDDPIVARCIRQQRPFYIDDPNCLASRYLRDVAMRLLRLNALPGQTSSQGYFASVIGSLSSQPGEEGTSGVSAEHPF